MNFLRPKFKRLLFIQPVDLESKHLVNPHNAYMLLSDKKLANIRTEIEAYSTK